MHGVISADNDNNENLYCTVSARIPLHNDDNKEVWVQPSELIIGKTFACVCACMEKQHVTSLM